MLRRFPIDLSAKICVYVCMYVHFRIVRTSMIYLTLHCPKLAERTDC